MWIWCCVSNLTLVVTTQTVTLYFTLSSCTPLVGFVTRTRCCRSGEHALKHSTQGHCRQAPRRHASGSLRFPSALNIDVLLFKHQKATTTITRTAIDCGSPFPASSLPTDIPWFLQHNVQAPNVSGAEEKNQEYEVTLGPKDQLRDVCSSTGTATHADENEGTDITRTELVSLLHGLQRLLMVRLSVTLNRRESVDVERRAGAPLPTVR